MTRITTALLLLLAAACGDDGGGDDFDVVDGNARPIADAGADVQVLIGQQVYLNGSGSRDRESSLLTYHWSLATVPAGSAVALSDAAVVNPTFVPDRHGTYVVTLAVDDGELLSETDAVTVQVSALPPDAQAGGDQMAIAGGEVFLDGSASTDPAGEPLSFTWSFTGRPEGSAATLQDADAARARFVPDLPGAYAIALRAETVAGTTDTDEVRVDVYARGTDGTVAPLAYAVVDAEYSTALDRLVVVSSGPSQLHLIDPSTLDDVAVDLPVTPNAVSISPDGRTAAVGHDGWISIVALSPPALKDTYEVAADIHDLVLAGDGWAYGFPALDDGRDIQAVKVSTGAVKVSSGFGFRAGSRAKLHPGGATIYTANNGVSPSDIERYSIADGAVTLMYDSPYHGDYAMCGDLWLSDDGARIYTACGNVFRSSAAEAEDMTYSGSVGDLGVVHADDSATAGLVVVLQRTGNQWDRGPNVEVELRDRAFLQVQDVLALPAFPGAGRSWASNGRFAFLDAAGSQLVALVRAEEGSGLAHDHGLVRWALDP